MGPKTWSSLMFDDSFQRSKEYFTVLETLRVSGEWVRDILKTWESLCDQWHRDVNPNNVFNQAEQAAIEQNLAVVDRNVKASVKGLIARITSKAEEVKSLRDGVSFLGTLGEPY
jgi:hypothetical protein